jgi:hypothetical protein
MDDLENEKKTLLGDVKKEILSWLRKQFLLAGMIVTAVSIFGLHAIINYIYDEKLKEFKAETGAEFKLVIEEAGKASGVVTELEKNVQTLRSQVEEVSEAVSGLGGDLDSEAMEKEQRSRNIETEKRIREIKGKSSILVDMLLCTITDPIVSCNSNSELSNKISSAGYGSSPVNKIHGVRGYRNNFSQWVRNDNLHYIYDLFIDVKAQQIISFDDSVIARSIVEDIEADLGYQNSMYVSFSDFPEVNADVIILVRKSD